MSLWGQVVKQPNNYRSDQLVKEEDIIASIDEVTLEFAVAGRYFKIRESYIDGKTYDEYNPVSSEFDASNGLITCTIGIIPMYDNDDFSFNTYIMGVDDIEARSYHTYNCDFVLASNGMLDITGMMNNDDFSQQIITKCTYQGISLNMIITVNLVRPF